MLENFLFWSFASFLIGSLTPFNNKLESSRYLTFFITPSISSLGVINVVIFVPEPNALLCIPASAADTAELHPTGVETLLANGLISFFINGNRVFSNGLRCLLRSPPQCIILDN